MTGGRFGTDFCTSPPGCGWLRPIVHIGAKGVMLCGECYDALRRGGRTEFSDSPKTALDESLEKLDRFLEKHRLPEPGPRTAFWRGALLGGALVAGLAALAIVATRLLGLWR